MDIRKFNKIVIVSLCDNKSKSIGKKLAQNLDMMFCDAKELVEYELIDRQALQKFCTADYLLAQEQKVFKHIASFEGVVVAISFDNFFHNQDILKEKSLVVFLKFSKAFCKENANIVDFLAYDGHSNDLQKLANLTLPIRKTDDDFVCNKIIEQLGGLL